MYYVCVLECNLFFWSKLNLKHHNSSLQCHMIFRNHVDLLQKKHFLSLWWFTTIAMLVFFEKTMQSFIFQDSLMNRKFKRTVFILYIYIILYIIINVFTVSFDLFNASVLIKRSVSFQNKQNPDYLFSFCHFSVVMIWLPEYFAAAVRHFAPSNSLNEPI